MSEAASKSVLNGRKTIKNILERKDKRRFVLIGPCSIHDPAAAIDYGHRLKALADQVQDTLCLAMRVYFEKPRSTIGWKGLINDPHMNGSFEIEEGLHIGRRLLLELAEMGLPLATEALDPISPQYMQDLISWSAIGARTTESQTHREMSSGLSCTVGFKNGTDGSLAVAVNALKSVSHPHNFLGIDAGGHVAYTVFKEVDYGTSLLTGPYKDTNFAQAYKAAASAKDKDFVKLVDFEPYHPSYNAPASFISSPIFDGDEIIGVLLFQMPIDKINDIMTNKHQWAKVGLGQSGETYIVGDDFLLRNQSRFLIEDRENYLKLIQKIGLSQETISKIDNFNSTIGLQPVKTQGTEAALQGETGTQIFSDYRGVPVLSSYKPLNISDVNWAIMSEIDEAEAFSQVRKLRNNILFLYLKFSFDKSLVRNNNVFKFLVNFYNIEFHCFSNVDVIIPNRLNINL